MLFIRASLLLSLGLGSAACLGTAPARPAMDRVFGPVIGSEAIVGRARTPENRVLLLVRRVGLVSLDLDQKSVERAALPAEISQTYWGLARLSDGSLWTLKDRHALIGVDAAGHVLRQIALVDPHIGLFALDDRLLYQKVDFTPPAPALAAGPPGEEQRAPWSDMRTRLFGMTRPLLAAINVVSCGDTRTAERPCWFPDESAVWLIDRTGHTRRVELGGLERVSPEVLLTSDRPSRPVRDAYVDAAGEIWIIGTGHRPPDVDLPGGWLLAKYRSNGRRIFQADLKQPARLILRVESGHLLVLSGDGFVVEVHP